MLDDLKAFIAVVDKTSLTKAAESLSLTQSAVSRRVQQLEERLGARLLDRSSRPPTATAIGRRIYLSAMTVLRDVDLLMRIPRDDEEPAGTFRLGLPQVIADVALFEIAMRAKASFPMLGLKCVRHSRATDLGTKPTVCVALTVRFKARKQSGALKGRASNTLEGLSGGTQSRITLRFGACSPCSRWLRPQPYALKQRGIRASDMPNHCFLGCSVCQLR